MTKIYKRRKLHGLESRAPRWHSVVNECGRPDLSYLLFLCGDGDRIHLCGPLDRMTREWMLEPLSKGWRFGGEFAFKHRTAVYEWNCEKGPQKTVHVKLASHRESWFPGCEDAQTGCDAWCVLESEWKSTGLPLLSSPAATGKALLWESLPCDAKTKEPIEFPALPDNLARLIRANSPQHRIEWIRIFPELDYDQREVLGRCVQYDGRWMYASLCGLDRIPVGAPRRAEGFTPYVPGIYDVTIQIPKDWNQVGLLPVRGGNLKSGIFWEYPFKAGLRFRTWTFEPELTLAIEGVKKLGFPAWEIFDFHDGYTFEKGRPLAGWSAKLIEMRKALQWTEAHYVDGGDHGGMRPFTYAAAAVRQILNHTIGAIHKNEFQRETFISDDNYRKWRRENPHLAEGDDVQRVEGGYMIPTFVPDTSRLSIFMPHWSAALYSQARARVAGWALLCDPATLVKIHGDAIYSTCEQPKLDGLDDGKTLGRPRRK